MATFPTYNKPVLLEPRSRAQVEAYLCEEDVKQGQVLKPGGTNADEVEPSATDGEECVGVAMYDASAGEMVDVVLRGLVRLQSGDGNVAAHDQLASHGGTTEGSVETAASGDHAFGVARFADSGTAGGSTLADVVAHVDFIPSEHASEVSF